MARKKKVETEIKIEKETTSEVVEAEKVVEVIVLHPFRFKENPKVIYQVGTKLNLSVEKYEEIKKKELIKKV